MEWETSLDMVFMADFQTLSGLALDKTSFASFADKPEICWRRFEYEYEYVGGGQLLREQPREQLVGNHESTEDKE